MKLRTNASGGVVKVNRKTDNSNHPGRDSRRAFMKKTTLAGAGLAAGAALPGAVVAATPAEPEKKKQQGYHVTQHVLDYYKTLL
jgi:nitrous oxide reductase